MRYIEILGAAIKLRYELTDGELHSIGKFTRENVAMWFERHYGPDWLGILPVEDFHAVCGDIHIPWATEDGRKLYEISSGVSVGRKAEETISSTPRQS